MGTQTVRVSKRTHEELRELSNQYGESMQAVLAYAVEELRRKRFFEQANAAYAALQDDQAAFQEYISEQKLWENTLADGLNEGKSAMEAESATTCG